MRVLAVDTSTATGSVALVDDAQIVAEVQLESRSRHAENLLPVIRTTLGWADASPESLALLAVGIGPGSFTGLRTSLATVKGLAFALDRPVVGVPSIEVLAFGMARPPAVAIPVIDAHKNEVFAAAYRVLDDEVEELVSPRHGAPGTLLEDVVKALGESDPHHVWLAGNGLRRHPVPSGLAAARVCPPRDDVPRAALLAELARRRFDRDGPSDLVALEPLYLRASDAKLPKEPLSIDHVD
ncbi:MAG: tRNA (adenosine(37)-N6)-threonylcarbamoyltransferase complex dimerization subunit type 1 TsaB [Myxococcota bacterium]